MSCIIKLISLCIWYHQGSWLYTGLRTDEGGIVILESLFLAFLLSPSEKMLNQFCVSAVGNRLFRSLDSYSKPKNRESKSKHLNNVSSGDRCRFVYLYKSFLLFLKLISTNAWDCVVADPSTFHID